MGTKKNAETVNEVNESVANVENMGQTSEQNASNEIEENLTVEQKKAQQVLRAKLPALHEMNFNFEKRTGSLFTASIVKVFDESGEPVIEDGVQKEKLVRKVVEVESEDGEILPKYAAIKEELNAKRAAAYVLNADNFKEKLIEKRSEALKALQAIDEQLDGHTATLSNAVETVMSLVLPERTVSERLSVTAKLNVANDKMDKMRAMLLAAGFSEEEINAQLNF